MRLFNESDMKIHCFLLLILLPTLVAGQVAVLVQYDTLSRDPAVKFRYADTLGNTFLRQLRTENNLPNLLNGLTTDREKALALLDWTHRQWKHNGDNEPSQGDALTILREAREGRQFRCVEYATVLAAACQSVGYRARTVALKTKDVETAKSGAGHVLVETWLPQFDKWVLLDGQYNVMPEAGGIPLNAVELGDALRQRREYGLFNRAGEVKGVNRTVYLFFIARYLYYLDVAFDNREPAGSPPLRVGEKSRLMLLPLGAHQPRTFQGAYPLDDLYFTNSVRAFYAKP